MALISQSPDQPEATRPGQLVVGAVLERVRHAVRVPRPAAVHVTAEELEGHAVRVRVDVAAHLLVRRDAGVRVPGDVELGLGVVGAAAGQSRREGRARVGRVHAFC